MIIRIFFLLILSSTCIVLAQTPDRLFDKANEAYQQGKLQEAKEGYETILRQGIVSGQLYYNLGNVYYRLGDIPAAILQYERAHRLIPNDDDLNHNLQLARLLVVDKIEPAPRLFVWDYWESIKSVFSLGLLTWLTYSCYVIVVAGIAGILLSRSYRMRKTSFITSFVAGAVFVIFIAIFAGKLSDVHSSNSAIVTASITTVKNSPDSQSSDAFVLHGGVKINITDHVNEWIKIRIADGKVGWMMEDAATVI